MADLHDRNVFVTTLAGSHGERLRRHLASRLRHARRDVPDLVQEVFLRLWRIPRPEAIQNPEAYLFTIANHVLHQYALRQSMTPATLNLLETVPAHSSESDPASQAELQQRLEELASAMAGLSLKAQAALVLYRRDGFSLEEIARLSPGVRRCRHWPSRASFKSSAAPTWSRTSTRKGSPVSSLQQYERWNLLAERWCSVVRSRFGEAHSVRCH